MKPPAARRPPPDCAPSAVPAGLRGASAGVQLMLPVVVDGLDERDPPRTYPATRRLDPTPERAREGQPRPWGRPPASGTDYGLRPHHATRRSIAGASASTSTAAPNGAPSRGPSGSPRFMAA